jgi:low temperature requirement protein LtrA
MRLAMVALWLRAAKSDPARRRLALSYAVSLLIAQAGWVGLAFLPLSVGPTSAVVLVLYVIELAAPYVSERTKGGSPWHPHHIAERYGLLVIIALGEVILGTVEAVETLVGESGWSVDAAILLAAGISLAFTLWWVYFTIPFGDILHASRTGSFLWGYSHVIVFASIAAVGAGLHLVALTFAHQSELSSVGVIAAVVVPLAVLIGVLIGVTLLILPSGHPIHAWLTGGSAALLTLAVGLAVWGAPVPVCLVVAVLAPIAWVVEFEIVGHQHIAQALSQLEAAQ